MDGRDCLVPGVGILSSGREDARVGKAPQVPRARPFCGGGSSDAAQRDAVEGCSWRSAVCILEAAGAARSSSAAAGDLTAGEEMFLGLAASWSID